MDVYNDLSELFGREADSTTKRRILNEIFANPIYKREFVKQKNLLAMLASRNEMPDAEIDALFSSFQARISNRKKRQVLLTGFMRYAAVIVIASGITLLLTNLLTGIPHPADQLTTVLSENGQQSTVVLPDSSVVRLNYNSRLTYASDYGVNNRDVQLTGEAYFDVRHNPEKEFTVKTKQLNIRVLGTQFSVQSYDNSPMTRVVLESGSVEIRDSSDQFHHRMIPGQMAFYDRRTSNLTLHRVNVQKALAWRDGLMYFDDTPMQEVINQLERKYNISIEVKNPKVLNTVFTATIKNESIRDVLKLIEYSCLIDYRIISQQDFHSPSHIQFDIKRPVR